MFLGIEKDGGEGSYLGLYLNISVGSKRNIQIFFARKQRKIPNLSWTVEKEQDSVICLERSNIHGENCSNVVCY